MKGKVGLDVIRTEEEVLSDYQSDPHIPELHSLLTGGKSGSRWGVGLPAPKLHPSNPREVEEVTLTDSNCQLASQRRGKRGDRGQEERGEERRGEELARIGER
ncbi:unnamed protein product [Pleuronectes platessa]|uniref:Uncharacterized protein n=1 Tax=Pleuronectes platessa TaxID=8262 RepID=A0A9N7VCJ0_PLEPL|nr:unnamed protein product [Pleuronectes platessa]